MTEQITFTQIVLSSALVSAVVNVLWAIASKTWDHHKEKEIERRIQAHTLLGLATDLETFSDKCDHQLHQIFIAENSYRDYNDDRKLATLKDPDFTFDSSPKWEILPVETANTIKDLKNSYENCSEWIMDGWLDSTFDMEETIGLSEEQFAYYGLEAEKLAKSIREKINSPSKIERSNINKFEHILSERVKLHESIIVIPEIKKLRK